jgi:hypothetical protein
VTVREKFGDAIKYWEPRRLVYNAALAATVLVYFFRGYPASRHNLDVNLVLLIFLLAVMANVAYCAAYLADAFAQFSALDDQWRRYRWVLFLIGLAFAMVITRFFAMGLFLQPNR